MTKKKTERSLQDLWLLTRYAGIVLAPAVLGYFLLEHFLKGVLLGTTPGFALGYLVAVGNLHMLGRSVAPMLHYGEKKKMAIGGTMFSLFMMAAVTLIVGFIFPNLLLGLAVGFASPVLFGVMYAIYKAPG